MTAKEKIEDIAKEIDRLSKKITRRIEKLEKQTGGNPVITYRHDPSIRRAIKKIRNLYLEGKEICVHYHLGEEVFRIFGDKPAIIKRLELSEEEVCPI